MKLIIAFAFGAGIGISGVFLHNSYKPAGITISLIAIWYGAYLVRQMHQSRWSNLSFSLGWLVMIIQASALGNGGELLVESNGYGNAFVLIGMALLAISLFRAQRVS